MERSKNSHPVIAGRQIVQGRHLFFVVVFLVTGFAQVCFSADVAVIARETISGQILTENGFQWHYGYDIEFRDEQIMVKVAVNLVPGEGVTRMDLERVKAGWEKEIENIWSRQCFVLTQTGQRYPVVVDVTFKGTWFHHDVIVRKSGGKCCSNELNWHLMDTGTGIAHEFGHMLGNYDEYRRGALDPVAKIIDPTSIMTSLPKHGMAYPRHFQRFLDWFKEKNPSGPGPMAQLKMDQKRQL